MDWYAVREAAVLTERSESTIRKRVQRLNDSESGLFRRVDSIHEGGHGRLELHRTLVERWMPASDKAEPSAPIESAGRHDVERPEVDVLREHLDYATQTARGYEIELHQAELALRDKELEMVRSQLAVAEQQLAERDFELADKRDELRRLGQLVADLYK